MAVLIARRAIARFVAGEDLDVFVHASSKSTLSTSTQATFVLEVGNINSWTVQFFNTAFFFLCPVESGGATDTLKQLVL